MGALGPMGLHATQGRLEVIKCWPQSWILPAGPDNGQVLTGGARCVAPCGCARGRRVAT